MAAHTLTGPAGETVVILRGHFEAADAWTVHQLVQAAVARCPVLLEFSQVATYEDFAVALLAPDLLAPAVGVARVRVRGLGPHQRRLLEYFGVSPLALQAPRRGGTASRDASRVDAGGGEPPQPRPD